MNIILLLLLGVHHVSGLSCLYSLECERCAEIPACAFLIFNDNTSGCSDISTIYSTEKMVSIVAHNVFDCPLISPKQGELKEEDEEEEEENKLITYVILHIKPIIGWFVSLVTLVWSLSMSWKYGIRMWNFCKLRLQRGEDIRREGYRDLERCVHQSADPIPMEEDEEEGGGVV